jgi:hypothetical protein
MRSANRIPNNEPQRRLSKTPVAPHRADQFTPAVRKVKVLRDGSLAGLSPLHLGRLLNEKHFVPITHDQSRPAANVFRRLVA